MSRAAVGVIIGFLFMLVAPFIFTEWEVNALMMNATMDVSLGNIFSLMSTESIRAFYWWFGLGFQGDASLFNIIGITGGFSWLTVVNLREIVWMTVMAWLSTAFVIGLIVKGAKRSTFAALGVFIVYLALYLIFSVLLGNDIAFMFTGAELMDTLGVLLTGVLCSVLGGVIGGAVSAAGEE